MSLRSKMFSQIVQRISVALSGSRSAGAPGSSCRACSPGDQRRGDEGREQRDEGRQDLRALAEHAQEREAGQQHGDRPARPTPTGLMSYRCARLNSMYFGLKAQRLVDDEVGGQRADPAGREIGVDDQDAFDGTEDADLHQQQRQQHVEHQPHHAARVADA